MDPAETLRPCPFPAHAGPYPLPAQERRPRAVSPEGIRCCDARRELHLRPGLEAWANGSALNAPLPQRVGNEKEETTTVAEAPKLLAMLPDGARLCYSADETIFEIGQIELVPVTAQGDSYIATFDGASDGATRVAVVS